MLFKCNRNDGDSELPLFAVPGRTVRLCDRPTGDDSPSFLLLSNRCWPEKHFQAVTRRADDAVTCRQHRGV